MTITIETPKGSHHKYKYKPKQQTFAMHKSLPDKMVFPFDFGFLPNTIGEDGDPLDVLILFEESTSNRHKSECAYPWLPSCKTNRPRKYNEK